MAGVTDLFLAVTHAFARYGRLVEAAVFHVDLELAAEGDPIDDPTAIWPDDREHVRVGALEITAFAFDREQDGDVLVFDPSRVTDGIEMTDDKILLARSGAYRSSVTRRTANSTK